MPTSITGTDGGLIGSSTQSWQNVTSSRATGTTYTNSTGKPIQVLFCGGANGIYNAFVNGVQISTVVQSNQTGTQSFIVPNGNTYQVTGPSVNFWSELR